MKKFTSILLIALLTASPFVANQTGAWGFYAHKMINRLAVFTLPPEMFGFYKANIGYISDHAIDPDKRRYALADEAPKHFIDIDRYGKYPYPDLPRKWKDAVEKYSEDTLKAHGIVPWNTLKVYYQLVNAFKDQNVARILKISADIGHYIGDAHVPLHATKNYNGQFTNQEGIHGLLESRLPELFAIDYDFFVGKAVYYQKPGDEIWKAVLTSATLVDTVLHMEKQATATIPADRKYAFEQRGRTTVKVYSKEFSKKYEDLLGGMVERRMRDAVVMVGSIWYSAWVDAGQPDLNKLAGISWTPIQDSTETIPDGKPMIGRPEAD